MKKINGENQKLNLLIIQRLKFNLKENLQQKEVELIVRLEKQIIPIDGLVYSLSLLKNNL